jgi:sterol desaturase/sphingolipid hydroxylase (fatty acid hydroxylase superfamily)
MELILIAVPFFFLLIGLELAWGLLRRRNTYRLNDTINSLSLGSLSRLQGLVLLGFSGLIYEAIVARFQLSQLPDEGAWVWISCFVLYDLAYYWKHRLGHEVALFWGSHVAHHQSEDFNLGTALRQTSIEFHGFLFYLPFFIIGYPAEILFTVVSLNLIYQFWVHTEHLPRLGPLEWLLVTPSNHRVHHARNDLYVDRNYGGVFIIWDRLFGSFQDELAEHPPVYGLRKPLNSWNPLWANIHVYWRLLVDTWRTDGFGNKLRMLFKAPGWQPPGQRSACQLKARKIDLSSRYDPQISRFARYYTLLQFIVTVLVSLWLLSNSPGLSYFANAVAVGYLAFSFYVHGVWLEGRSFAVALELLRLLALAALLQTSLFAVDAGALQLLALLSAVTCLGAYWQQRRAGNTAAVVAAAESVRPQP